ncbi:MAG: tRNA epoxyqueuosine(34) reductase QueG, partial [Alphaproteobacteria bacterium]
MTTGSIQARGQGIRDRALALGFDAVGFARARLGDEARRGLAEFLAEGRHGDMEWMEANAARRGDPRVLWPEARSVVMLGASYAPDADPMEMLTRRDRGAISAYARRRDYHDVVKGRLKTLAGWMVARLGGEAKVFVDTAPVMEKPLAAAAGIGWQGKHTNLVSAAHGSWLFLGAVFTTLELEPDAPHEDRCGSCTRCLDACPTKAFP